MVWSIAFGALMGVGGFLAPTYVSQWLNPNPSDPMVRMELIESENLREQQDEPSNLTPYRVHGGVGPASSSI